MSMRPDFLVPAQRAADHSPLSFLRERRAELAEHAEEALATAAAQGDLRTSGTDARWYWRLLRWDTEHFGRPMIRIDGAGWEGETQDPADGLAASLAELRAELASAYPGAYVWSEVPASDLVPLGVLGAGGFRLIETRLAYYTLEPALAVTDERHPVRPATAADVPHLREVAARADNPSDRYHADPQFSLETARRYLATYAEESLRRLATAVLVPDPGDGAPAGAFFTLDGDRGGSLSAGPGA